MTARGRATVQGLGRFGGGIGAARFLAREGWDVTVTDLQSEVELADSVAALDDVAVRFVLGAHDRADFTGADLVVANPAVPADNEHLNAAREAGVRIVSEVGLFLERCPCPVVAVTGTQGKSSTAHFLHQLLLAAEVPAKLGGNIGGSLLDELSGLSSAETFVIELSSYQLEGLAKELGETPLALGVITNLCEDHLERHGSVDAYHAAKLELLRLLPADAPLLVGEGVAGRLGSLAPDATERITLYELGAAMATLDQAFTFMGERLGDTGLINHLPDFQRENILLALSAARLLGADGAELAAALPTLTGLEHRLEELSTAADRLVYDNGVSTTPDSTEAALSSLPKPLTLIAGGRAKALPIDRLVRAVAERSLRVVLFGACATEWAQAFCAAGVLCEVTADVPEAVQTAWRLTSSGDTILFSPAAASFDAYPNFLERAAEFRSAVAALCQSERSTS